MGKKRKQPSPQEVAELAANPVFQALLEWMEQRFAEPYLRAEPPHKLLPNYSEVVAAQAAQYRVVREVKQWLDSRLSRKP